MKTALSFIITLCMTIPPALFAQTTQPAASRAATPGEQWDQRFDRAMYLYGKEPVAFLKEKAGLLKKGKTLCLAAGEGRNAVYLAQQGFDVTALDASKKGLEKCTALAKQRGVTVKTIVADLSDYDLGKEQYDLITDFYYHDQKMFPKIMAALKPGGMFIMQNFAIDQPKTNRFGPKNPSYLVKPNEVLSHFSGYRILHYEDTVVNLDEGMHQGAGAVVRLIVVKEGVE